jgi:hypothetical protein
MRAEAMRDRGDMAGRAVWLRVVRAVRAVEELLDTRPKDHESTH